MDPSRRLLFAIFAAVFGLMIGSFLNVCIFRLPRRCMSIAKGRSRCPSCRNEIAWYDNIPVVSWIVLGGKCRYCDFKISPRYLLVELLTGALIAWAAYVQLYRPVLDDDIQRITLFAIQVYLVCAIIVSTFIDVDFEILPDEITLSGLAFGIVAGAAFPEVLFGTMPVGLGWLEWLSPTLRPYGWGLAQSVVGALVGGGAIYAVGVFGTLLLRRKVRELKLDSAMGLGDVKYMAFLGAFLGWEGAMLVFLVSVFAGAFFGIGRFIAVRRFGKVPFGPFLSLGALAVLFAKPQLIGAVQAYLNIFRR